MAKVKSGDTVQVHYAGTLQSGELFDSSEGRDPLEFKVGEGMVIPGFDAAMIDMEVGEKKTVHIPVDQAYGARSEEAFVKMPRTEFDPELNPQVGQELHLSDNQGHVFPVVVVEVAEDAIILDANHPLAGEPLTFEISLVGIK
ncbi:MAG: FKBP-type peptidyl-prolyl cis-trans isomerase [Bacteroidetes bacterium]|nr:FKBP-type peptidyl-prolyl cis-trans isomerase [Bacteroidota bacterium]